MAPVLALLLGRARRERYEQLRQTRLLYEQTKLAETEHQRAGALAERARIAREIHDVLAHSLGALAIQLELAEVMLTENDDIEQATARIRQSRELTDQGLTETRRAVRALRADAPPLPEAIAGLAAAQRAGDRSAVDFDTEGEPRPLSAEINLALLRTAQEALVNAAKHAPGHAVRVRLVYRSEETVLSVSDFPTRGVEDNRHPTPAAPPGVGGGYGLAGMRERLALAGGSLVAGPSNEPGASGWTVTARVPA
jgi:signal transduction histidine kinase